MAALTGSSVVPEMSALHKAPPDILFSNDKQLDDLFTPTTGRSSPMFQSLWRHNGRLPNSSSTSRDLVVDEFHPLDGTQRTPPP
ncbi:MAG: hypothetical protein ACK52U_09675 [Synechococcaceae cyanobacterium]|jgi:hypothetical protein